VKIKTRKHPIKGDRSEPFITIVAIDNKGREQVMFGLFPRRNKHGRWYECDGGGSFLTITEAKMVARRKALCLNHGE
jgi:hypothetical protein